MAYILTTYVVMACTVMAYAAIAMDRGVDRDLRVENIGWGSDRLSWLLAAYEELDRHRCNRPDWQGTVSRAGSRPSSWYAVEDDAGHETGPPRPRHVPIDVPVEPAHIIDERPRHTAAAAVIGRGLAHSAALIDRLDAIDSPERLLLHEVNPCTAMACTNMAYVVM